jgi:hypothetical protein
MQGLEQTILRTDIGGMPLEWIHYQMAVKLFYTNQVAYAFGSKVLTVHGGVCALTGEQSIIHVQSIIATRGSNQRLYDNYIPPLNNPTLFKRDDHICMYCGEHFPYEQLSRDHVIPVVQGGRDIWTNVVTACRECNNEKGGLKPEQAGMELIAVPFQPTYAEYIFLKGRNILADQMEFLSAHFPRSSPLRARI